MPCPVFPVWRFDSGRRKGETLIRARKSLGQNFLIDPNIARKVAALVDVGVSEPIVEIGPGQGMLTRYLKSLPGPLYVIEVDPRCIAHLRECFRDDSGISIIQEDFLDTDVAGFGAAGQMRWVGNLPYNISSAILFKLLSHHARVCQAVFMLQKEVAERITARHGSKSYGILSVLLQTFYAVRLEFSVSRNVFRPVPKVASAVVSFEAIENQLTCGMQDYQSLVKTGFNQRRKLLRNALGPLIKDQDLSEIAFNFDRRAEEVSVAEWMTLSDQLFQAKSPT